MQNALPWILVALLVLVLALLVRDRRRRDASARHALDAAAADAERRRIVDATERTRSLSIAEEHRVTTVAELTAMHAAELAAAEERTRIARVDEQAARELVSATWGHEASSHAHIVAAFAAARLPGILATNVVFSRTSDDGARFVQQIDHVVVTARTVLIIENKRWRGIVFDGVVPSSEHAAFAQLVDESSLGRTFAVQIARLSKSASSQERIVRSHVGRESPATQVRGQAVGLRELLEERLGLRVWCETAVLYSHDGASLFVRPEDRTDGGAVTRILAGRSGLDAYVREMALSAGTGAERDLVEPLAALFRAGGAHVEPLGLSGRS
ncbi:NERD domain-containing protein [Clavibacter capsici]|uniref:nuclease-related domain-containing protein n=1 Tax=Clavibacter capsici TaxID=1874630 RepID=UPI0014284CCB|nr:nuclease-related domain-containing protein [Clavibacter capsici]QIS41929.1 NERD domain-containing protein [Clavibacter capsici]